MKRRVNGFILLMIVSISALVLGGCGAKKTSENTNSSKDDDVINIGYQKFGSLNILKSTGDLDKRLEEEGYTVKWIEFPGGPQLLEALNVGSIDFGHTGETPPVIAQAANAPLVYLYNQPANPKGEAILIHKDSPIKSVADLKGKKVALNKGSNVHYLLVKALEKANLTLDDIEPVYLPPADARTAFEGNQVDAWVIWDPFLSAAELEIDTKVLQDGTELAANREFFLATKTLATKHKEVVEIIKEELEKADKLTEENHQKMAEFLAPEIGMTIESLERTLTRKTYGLQPITKEVLDYQQSIADSFYKLKLIPTNIDVYEATLDFKKK